MDAGKISKKNKGLFLSGMACLISIATMATEAAEFPGSLQGDIGMGAYYTHSIIRGKGDEVSVLPYADFEYGRMFARVDTLGIKTLQMGYGHLELVGRISQDGFSTNSSSLQGIASRETSIPLGIGTLQVTPLGALMVNLFHDVRRSGGDWFEAIYGGEIDLRRLTLYPLIGADYQSREYVGYYYGISPQEAAASQYAAYAPAGSLNGLFGLIGDIELSDSYHLNLYVRRKWLGSSIRQSPIVSQRYLDTGYLALSYRFK
ncbi:MipA/OmpV family protein [Sideroxydans lithotrophicus]|uniref:MltA-interacting MipA family protein n=1 Tax=Sideroxydans lithotrophicus (strain ES-1) TaxID=580332 RepID=D5CRT5_SIDLE|nr:MipA/OmpV family protein [Sideroxydans lithotrophicus]ADE11671.1 MltA-interacting MipA family protein [Sideroxydans lithotrophicus ES-1]